MASFSVQVAQQIVQEIETVIHHNINIMDDEGQIIASNDTSRIGSFHEGALDVIQEGKPLHIYSDDSHRGAKQGVNMPFYYKEELRGVIGITGDPHEVAKYAEIIRKMTEVMVKEAYVSRELEMEQRFKQLFIREWLQKQWTSIDDFLLRGKTLNINLEINRLALLFEVDYQTEGSGSDKMKQEQLTTIMTKIGESFNIETDDLLVLWQSDQFVLLKSVSNEDISAFMEQSKQLIAGLTGKLFHLRCGIGRMQDGFLGTVASFEDAKQALLFARRKKETVVAFHELGIESLVRQVPDELKEEFISRLFPIFLSTEHKQLLHTLRSFLYHGQSINRTSENLYIHKNTLQYRLKKMKYLTGYDPRNFQDAVLYWLALAFYDDLFPAGNTEVDN